MKEALGGAALGVVTGYILGRGRGTKISVPKDIEVAVAKLSAFVLPPGLAPVPLVIKPVLKFVHFGNITGVMYALVNCISVHPSPSGQDVDNPEAVMSVWVREGMVVFELGQQAGSDVVVYRDTTQMVVLSGLARGWAQPVD